MQRDATAPIVPPTPADIAAIRRQHVPVTHGRHAGEYCDCCSQNWPCDVAILLAHIARTTEQEAGKHEHDWQPVGFTPHPSSGGLMPTDHCRTCGKVRYPYSPEVEAY